MKKQINCLKMFLWALGLHHVQEQCKSRIWRKRGFYRREKKAEYSDLVSLKSTWIAQKYISSESLRKCLRRPKNQVIDNNKRGSKSDKKWIGKWQKCTHSWKIWTLARTSRYKFIYSFYFFNSKGYVDRKCQKVYTEQMLKFFKCNPYKNSMFRAHEKAKCMYSTQ